MKTVFIDKNSYYFNGENYNNKSIDELLGKIRKRLKVIILGENILIQKINNIYNSIEKCLLAYEVNNINNRDTLIDYEYDCKNKLIYIYSVKQGDKVNNITKNIKSLTVSPVQIVIKSLLRKKTKNIDYYAIVLIKGYVYVIEVKDNILVLANTYEYKNFNLSDYLDILNYYKTIFINNEFNIEDSYIEKNKNIKIVTLNIERFNYEKN